MRSNSVQDELADGIDLSSPAPTRADGGFDVPVAMPIDLPPRLCEQGPCRHYHRLEIVMDAAKPKGATFDFGAGKVLGEPPRVAAHTQVSHYCYPDVGIETELGAMPVVQCNRWDPILAETDALVQIRRKYLETTEDGQRYQSELADWNVRQVELAKADEASSEDAAKVLAEAEAARMARRTHKTTTSVVASHVDGGAVMVEREVCDADCPACAAEARDIYEALELDK